MKKLLYLLLIPLIAFSCDPVSLNPPEIVVKDKTVLLYMVGNNNLSSNAVSNLRDLKKGFIPTDDNLLVYYHTPTVSPMLFKIYKNPDGSVAQDTVYRFPSRNSATMQSLTSAMKVVQTMFPANEYGLFLWSHGTGWLPKGYYSSGSVSSLETAGYKKFNTYPQDIDPYAHLVKSFGSENGQEIEITDLAKAIPYKLSFIIFDACLMGTVETVYQLKDSVNYIISSPTEILTDGFPYSQIMQHIFKTPMDLNSVAKEYYDYYNHKSGNMRSATISVVNTAYLEELAAACANVFDKYRSSIPNVDVKNIQRYFRGNKHWFYDLGDFVNTLASPSDAASVTDVLSKVVTYKATTPYFLDIDIDADKFSGLSIYIPSAPTDPALDEFYKKFSWNTASKLIE